ncbi:MAG: flagellar biosynthesis protein FlhB [Pseudomonadota bacterium]
MAENDNKTEQATPKRMQDARKKGQVAKSREVASAFIMVACLIYLYFGADGIVNQIVEMMQDSFRGLHRTDLTVTSIQSLMISLLLKLLMTILPLLLTLMVAGFLANFIQVGILFSTEAIQPKLSKVSPLKGLKNLFSFKTIAELLKSTLKITLIGFIAYVTIRNEVLGVLPLMEQNVGQVMTYMGRISFKILLATCWVLIALALMDYLYQRWEHSRNMKMSKQDIKDESKNTEGDPLIKARIRRLQREMAMRRMMAKVPTADVVITNPTHLAVALKYDQARMAAPVVVAKGANLVAERIKEIARENGVAVVENKPLAQVLYRMVDIAEAIPDNLYQAIAEILAYVYGLKRKQAFL